MVELVLKNWRADDRMIRISFARLLLTISLFALANPSQPASAQPSLNSVPPQTPKQGSGPSHKRNDSEAELVTLRGRCIDHIDKTPIGGAVIRVYEIKGYLKSIIAIRSTVTDDNGKFEFADMVPPRANHPIDRLFYLLLAEADNRPIGYGGSWTMNETNPLFCEIRFMRESGIVTGTITNSRGEPVEGANVSQWSYDGRPLPGILSATTGADGRFEIDRIPIFEGFGTSFSVSHANYLVKELTDIRVPADLAITLEDGCRVTGMARDVSTNKPSPLTVIVAVNQKTLAETTTVAGSGGRFQFVLDDGRYSFQAKRRDRVSRAFVDQDCAAGENLELPEFELMAGGMISGRVINTATNEVVTVGNSGQPVSIGFYGPSQPHGKVSSPKVEVQADSTGHYSLIAAPGENFPYFVNLQGDRMTWTTMEHPPVVVKEGETTNYDLLITPPVPPATKLQNAKTLVASFSKDSAERTKQILDEFRKLSHTVDETEVWCTLMRDLVAIGSDAVPQLCTELDQTDRDFTIRRLAFALRAIGDARAVPALIRALPKTLLPAASDYGLTVADGELMQFMQQHSQNDDHGGNLFDFDRAVHEVGAALKKLTRQNLNDETAINLSLSEDPRRQVLQQRIMIAAAKPWQSWWEEHWKDFTSDVAYSQVNLDLNIPPLPPAVETIGPTAHLGEDDSEGEVLSPVAEGGTYVIHFQDLDTGVSPCWPADIPRDESEFDNQKLTAWIEQNGIDLACVTYEAPNGEKTPVLKAFGMKVWEITPHDLQVLDKTLATGKLPHGVAVSNLLMHYDANTRQFIPDANAAFIYVTRDGSMGVIEVTDRITEVRDLTGQFGDPPKGVGFHKGVRFNLKTIIP